MVLATIRMLLSHQGYGEALNILRSIAEQNRVQPGCLSSRLYGDLEKEHTIIIEEMWQDQEALRRHLCSEEYRILLLILEMALEHPEIKFSTITTSTGIETIEKARTNQEI
jgi:quinol monooxygenase YgiN